MIKKSADIEETMSNIDHHLSDMPIDFHSRLNQDMIVFRVHQARLTYPRVNLRVWDNKITLAILISASLGGNMMHAYGSHTAEDVAKTVFKLILEVQS